MYLATLWFKVNVSLRNWWGALTSYLTSSVIGYSTSRGEEERVSRRGKGSGGQDHRKRARQ